MRQLELYDHTSSYISGIFTHEIIHDASTTIWSKRRVPPAGYVRLFEILLSENCLSSVIGIPVHDKELPLVVCIFMHIQYDTF